MTRWEYYELSPRRHRLTNYITEWEGSDGRQWQDWRTALSALGDEGWELIEGDRHHRCTLKRPKD